MNIRESVDLPAAILSTRGPKRASNAWTTVVPKTAYRAQAVAENAASEMIKVLRVILELEVNEVRALKDSHDSDEGQCRRDSENFVGTRPLGKLIHPLIPPLEE